MDAIAVILETPGIKEGDRQFALIDWARTRIDGIANRGASPERLEDLLEFMAHFTREYFGYQERLLDASALNREQLLERKATHAEFRRRLAQIYADTACGNATIATRLSALCQELCLDVQTQRDDFSALAQRTSSVSRVRRKSRGDSATLRAILRFNN